MTLGLTEPVRVTHLFRYAQHWISLLLDLVLSTFGAGRTCTRGSRSDGALEIGVRTGTTMDRNMLGDIKLQPLDVVVERYGVRADFGNRRPRRGRAHVRANENLRLRQIHDRHVAGVIEALDMVTDDRLVAVADRMPFPIRLQLPGSRTRRRKWELRQPVRAQSTRLGHQHDSFVEVLVQLIRDNRGAFRVRVPEAAGMIPVMVRVDDVPNLFARNKPFGFGDHRVGA